MTEPQNRAPSAAVPAGVRESQIPSTCFSPSASTPIASHNKAIAPREKCVLVE